MSAFITGCLSLPLVTQCFDWIGAETAGELAEERHATTTMVAETQEQAAAEQEQQKQLAMAKQQDELQAAVAAVGDVTLGMDQAVLDEAVLQGQELDGRESQPARRPSRRRMCKRGCVCCVCCVCRLRRLRVGVARAHKLILGGGLWFVSFRFGM